MKNRPDKKVTDRQSLANWLNTDPPGCWGVVFASGCFRALHLGHVRMLNYAASLGSILVVGLNADDSPEAAKRSPWTPLSERQEMLAALQCVDWVVPFSEATPCELVRVIRPTLIIKGHDARGRFHPEAALAPLVFSPPSGYNGHSSDLLDGNEPARLRHVVAADCR